jgi:4-amino-4-deoxy-L-arabinose transferase-like glycosyltransferase
LPEPGSRNQITEIRKMSETPRSRPLTDWLLLAGFCGFLFFFGLAYFGLLGADEPRYAQVAREMLARHDWITPTLGGRPWLEKPSLYYWQAMLAYAVFGVSDWAGRLPSAADASLMVVAVYLFFRRFRPGFHLDGALMTASAAGVIGFARAASMDMPLAATFTIAMLAWFAWHETSAKSYLAAFYVFLALATLAKGPLAPLLAAVIVVVFAIAKGELSLLRKTLWVPGLLLFCGVALPWHIAVQARNPEFFHVFILQHNFGRFGANLYHHKQPFWYYVPVVLLALVPWTVFIVTALLETVRGWWPERGRQFSRDSFRSDPLSAFLVIWLVVPIVFFTFSQSKLPGYILPAIPPATLLLAEYVRRHIGEDKRPAMTVVALHSVVAALPLIPAMMIPFILLQHRLPWGGMMAISVTLATGLAIGIAATLRAQAGLRMLRLVTIVPAILAVTAALKIGAPAVDATLSARPLAEVIGRMENKSLPLAVFQTKRETEYGLAFYRNQAISRYERGEMPAGEHLLITPEGLQAAVAKQASGRRVSYLGSYAAQGLDYYWVAAGE